jgi:aarF domain-containing kinase
LIVRPNPRYPREPQIVLLDHGLYVRLSEDFRREYALLWRGLLTLDRDVIASVTRGWGFGAPDLFASATLMRPVRFKKSKEEQEIAKHEEKLSDYELGQRMKAKMRDFLKNTDLMPKELAFIGRNMRIMQGMMKHAPISIG